MDKVIVCTDDICPEHIDEYWHHWEWLKVNHPKLILEAFVTPCYRGDPSQLITQDEFKEWYESVNDWVNLHLHGYDHTYPPEFTRTKEEQEKSLIEGMKLLSPIAKNTVGFKPPGYKFDSEITIPLIQKLKFHFMSIHDTVFFFPYGRIQMLSLPMIQTHTNGLTEDSIEKIVDSLDKKLEDKRFTTIAHEITACFPAF